MQRVHTGLMCSMFVMVVGGCPKSSVPGGTGGTTKRAPNAQWRLSATAPISYDLVRKKLLVQDKFTETDSINVELLTRTDGMTVATVEGTPSPPFKLSADGVVTPRQAPIALTARLLLALASPLNRGLAVGDRFETKIPADNELAGLRNEVVIQYWNVMTVVNIEQRNGDQRTELQVVGQQRLLDNEGMRMLVGPPSSTPTSQKAEAALRELASWNYYLVGTATWSEARGAPTEAALVVTIAPGTRSSIRDVETSVLRNSLTYKLR